MARKGAWGLLLALALGVGAAPDQVRPPYRDRCRNEGTEYFHEGYEVCCARCPPGMYAAQECTSDVNTVCQQCRPGTYTEIWNYRSNCISCPFCDTVGHLEEDIACTLTKKTTCRCKPGMHCELSSQMGCMHCSEHSKCPPGQEVATPGSALSDTQCTPCREGWFQDKTSLEARCQPHTDCLSQGLQVDGTSISDAVCAVTPVTETTTGPTDTRSEAWNYVSPLIIILVGVVVSILLLVTVLLIRKPSVYKEIGMFFRRGHQTANPHHQGNLERPPVSEPLLHVPTVEVPTRSSDVTGASFGPNDLVLKMVCENLQLEAPSDWLRGGPYMQETEPMSPSAGPDPQGSQEAVSAEKRCGESPERIQENLPQTADRSNGTPVSAGTNNGVHIEGKKVTINGNIYVFPQTMVGPPSTPEGSVRPVQVTQDSDDMSTSTAEVGPLPPDQPPPFCRGAAAWHCVVPQQEEGKDMHLATPESMNVDAWSGVQVRSPYIEEDGEMDLGRSLRLTSDDQFF